MFAVRIVKVEHYEASPIRGLDPCYSDFRNCQLTKVPVVRIFGSTPAGQKTCVHLHGIFPYIYIPYDGTKPVDRYVYQLAVTLEHALTANNSRADDCGVNYVYKVEVVSGTPFYGYHVKEHQFLKIYFLNPHVVERAVELLQSGSIMNRVFQPHEAHIPYILQMFIDYNLYGMNLIKFHNVKFRRKKLELVCDGQKDSPDLSDSIPFLGTDSPSANNLSVHLWDPDCIPSSFLLDETVMRQSTCELEVDAMAADVLNSLELAGSDMNPGIAAIWEDERLRRKQLNESSQLTPPVSQARQPKESTGTELLYMEKINIKLQLASESPEDEESLEEESQVHDQCGVETTPEENEGIIVPETPRDDSLSVCVQKSSQASLNGEDQEVLDLLLDLMETESLGSDKESYSPPSSPLPSSAEVDDDLQMSEIVWENESDADLQTANDNTEGKGTSMENSIPQVDGPSDPDEHFNGSSKSKKSGRNLPNIPLRRSPRNANHQTQRVVVSLEKNRGSSRLCTGSNLKASQKVKKSSKDEPCNDDTNDSVTNCVEPNAATTLATSEVGDTKVTDDSRHEVANAEVDLLQRNADCEMSDSVLARSQRGYVNGEVDGSEQNASAEVFGFQLEKVTVEKRNVSSRHTELEHSTSESGPIERRRSISDPTMIRDKPVWIHRTLSSDLHKIYQTPENPRQVISDLEKLCHMMILTCSNNAAVQELRRLAMITRLGATTSAEQMCGKAPPRGIDYTSNDSSADAADESSGSELKTGKAQSSQKVEFFKYGSDHEEEEEVAEEEESDESDDEEDDEEGDSDDDDESNDDENGHTVEHPGFVRHTYGTMPLCGKTPSRIVDHDLSDDETTAVRHRYSSMPLCGKTPSWTMESGTSDFVLKEDEFLKPKPVANSSSHPKKSVQFSIESQDTGDNDNENQMKIVEDPKKVIPTCSGNVVPTFNGIPSCEKAALVLKGKPMDDNGELVSDEETGSTPERDTDDEDDNASLLVEAPLSVSQNQSEGDDDSDDDGMPLCDKSQVRKSNASRHPSQDALADAGKDDSCSADLSKPVKESVSRQHDKSSDFNSQQNSDVAKDAVELSSDSCLNSDDDDLVGVEKQMDAMKRQKKQRLSLRVQKRLQPFQLADDGSISAASPAGSSLNEDRLENTSGTPSDAFVKEVSSERGGGNSNSGRGVGFLATARRSARRGSRPFTRAVSRRGRPDAKCPESYSGFLPNEGDDCNLSTNGGDADTQKIGEEKLNNDSAEIDPATDNRQQKSDSDATEEAFEDVSKSSRRGSRGSARRGRRGRPRSRGSRGNVSTVVHAINDSSGIEAAEVDVSAASVDSSRNVGQASESDSSSSSSPAVETVPDATARPRGRGTARRARGRFRSHAARRITRSSQLQISSSSDTDASEISDAPSEGTKPSGGSKEGSLLVLMQVDSDDAKNPAARKNAADEKSQAAASGTISPAEEIELSRVVTDTENEHQTDDGAVNGNVVGKSCEFPPKSPRTNEKGRIVRQWWERSLLKGQKKVYVKEDSDSEESSDSPVKDKEFVAADYSDDEDDDDIVPKTRSRSAPIIRKKGPVTRQRFKKVYFKDDTDSESNSSSVKKANIEPSRPTRRTRNSGWYGDMVETSSSRPTRRRTRNSGWLGDFIEFPDSESDRCYEEDDAYSPTQDSDEGVSRRRNEKRYSRRTGVDYSPYAYRSFFDPDGVIVEGQHYSSKEASIRPEPLLKEKPAAEKEITEEKKEKPEEKENSEEEREISEEEKDPLVEKAKQITKLNPCVRLERLDEETLAKYRCRVDAYQEGKVSTLRNFRIADLKAKQDATGSDENDVEASPFRNAFFETSLSVMPDIGSDSDSSGRAYSPFVPGDNFNDDEFTLSPGLTSENRTKASNADSSNAAPVSAAAHDTTDTASEKTPEASKPTPAKKGASAKASEEEKNLHVGESPTHDMVEGPTVDIPTVDYRKTISTAALYVDGYGASEDALFKLAYLSPIRLEDRPSNESPPHCTTPPPTKKSRYSLRHSYTSQTHELSESVKHTPNRERAQRPDVKPKVLRRGRPKGSINKKTKDSDSLKGFKVPPKRVGKLPNSEDGAQLDADDASSNPLLNSLLGDGGNLPTPSLGTIDELFAQGLCNTTRNLSTSGGRAIKSNVSVDGSSVASESVKVKRQNRKRVKSSSPDGGSSKAGRWKPSQSTGARASSPPPTNEVAASVLARRRSSAVSSVWDPGSSTSYLAPKQAPPPVRFIIKGHNKNSDYNAANGSDLRKQRREYLTAEISMDDPLDVRITKILYGTLSRGRQSNQFFDPKAPGNITILSGSHAAEKSAEALNKAIAELEDLKTAVTLLQNRVFQQSMQVEMLRKNTPALGAESTPSASKALNKVAPRAQAATAAQMSSKTLIAEYGLNPHWGQPKHHGLRQPMTPALRHPMQQSYRPLVMQSPRQPGQVMYQPPGPPVFTARPVRQTMLGGQRVLVGSVMLPSGYTNTVQHLRPRQMYQGPVRQIVLPQQGQQTLMATMGSPLHPGSIVTNVSAGVAVIRSNPAISTLCTVTPVISSVLPISSLSTGIPFISNAAPVSRVSAAVLPVISSASSVTSRSTGVMPTISSASSISSRSTAMPVISSAASIGNVSAGTPVIVKGKGIFGTLLNPMLQKSAGQQNSNGSTIVGSSGGNSITPAVSQASLSPAVTLPFSHIRSNYQTPANATRELPKQQLVSTPLSNETPSKGTDSFVMSSSRNVTFEASKAEAVRAARLGAETPVCDLNRSPRPYGDSKSPDMFDCWADNNEGFNNNFPFQGTVSNESAQKAASGAVRNREGAGGRVAVQQNFGSSFSSAVQCLNNDGDCLNETMDASAVGKDYEDPSKRSRSLEAIKQTVLTVAEELNSEKGDDDSVSLTPLRNSRVSRKSLIRGGTSSGIILTSKPGIHQTKLQPGSRGASFVGLIDLTLDDIPDSSPLTSVGKAPPVDHDDSSSDMAPDTFDDHYDPNSSDSSDSEAVPSKHTGRQTGQTPGDKTVDSQLDATPIRSFYAYNTLESPDKTVGGTSERATPSKSWLQEENEAVVVQQSSRNALSFSKDKILTYVFCPPSPADILSSMGSYGIPEIRYPEAYCSDARDVPAKPMQLGGAVVLKLKSDSVADLAECESTLGNTGLNHWGQVLNVAAESGHSCKPDCGKNPTGLGRPFLQWGLCLELFPRPPSPAAVKLWLSRRVEQLEAGPKTSAAACVESRRTLPPITELPEPIPNDDDADGGAVEMTSSTPHSADKQLSKDSVSLTADFQSDLSPISSRASTADTSASSAIQPTDSSDVPAKSNKRKRQLLPDFDDVFGNSEAAVQFDSVLQTDSDLSSASSTRPKLKRSLSDGDSPDAGSDDIESPNKPSLKKVKHEVGETQSTVSSAKSSPIPSGPRVRRSLSCTEDNSLRRQLFLQKIKSNLPFLNKSERPETSQLDGPSPKNTYGFKVSAEALNDAKAVHMYQYLTLMSMELHVRTEEDLKPNPQHNPICAIFYYLSHDVPGDNRKKTLPKIAGIIIAEKLTPPSKLPEESLCEVDEGQEGASTSKRSEEVAQFYKKAFCKHAELLDDADVNIVQNEFALIQELVKIVQRHDPDILLGYEVQLLSWGFLVERAAILGMKLCPSLSRVPDDPLNFFHPLEEGKNTKFTLNIVGRIVLSMGQIMKPEVALYNYTFENVAYHVLHQRVPLYSFRTLTKWFDQPVNSNRWRTMQHYLVRTKGNVLLLEQLNIVGRTSELARLFGIQFYEVLHRGTQFRVESMMLRLCRRKKYIAVSPTPQQRASMHAPEYTPLIMEPISKLYTNPVVVLDFQSLYPSMMIAYNYCFSTCLGKVDNIGQTDAFQFGCTTLKIPAALLKKHHDQITVAPCGSAFVKSNVRKGILPRMLEEILATRIMVKTVMKRHKGDKALHRMLDARQLGLKLISNVTYGYTAANFSGRMPCVEIADSVVSKGRETLERAIELIHNNGRWKGKVVYGDTDSLFVLLEGRSKEQAFCIGQEIADAVTADNPKPVKLKMEKVYLPCVLQTKKRYAGFMYETRDQAEPVYDAKGIETVRRDGCPAVAKILEKSIKVLFSTSDVSQVKSYVQHQFTKLLKGRSSLSEYVFTREYHGRYGYQLEAHAPALKIAKQLWRNDPRAEPVIGERVPYVIVYGSPGSTLIELVRHPHEVLLNSSLHLNAKYYICNAICPALDRVLSLIGADVKQWYATLPRSTRYSVPHENQPREISTISQYFAATNCPVCDGEAQTGVCLNCLTNPQKCSIVLTDRIRDWERRYHHTAKVCQGCSGTPDPQMACVSLDCPVLFRLAQATRDLAQAPYLRGLVENFSLSW